MRLLHLTHAKPRKDYEVGFVLVAVRVFVPPTRPGKNCPVESGDAYMYATVVPYPVLSYPSHTIDPRESRREGREGRRKERRRFAKHTHRPKSLRSDNSEASDAWVFSSSTDMSSILANAQEMKCSAV